MDKNNNETFIIFLTYVTAADVKDADVIVIISVLIAALSSYTVVTGQF